MVSPPSQLGARYTRKEIVMTIRITCRDKDCVYMTLEPAKQNKKKGK